MKTSNPTPLLRYLCPPPVQTFAGARFPSSVGSHLRPCCGDFTAFPPPAPNVESRQSGKDLIGSCPSVPGRTLRAWMINLGRCPQAVGLPGLWRSGKSYRAQPQPKPERIVQSRQVVSLQMTERFAHCAAGNRRQRALREGCMQQTCLAPKTNGEFAWTQTLPHRGHRNHQQIVGGIAGVDDHGRPKFGTG
jgi:hypothetical protein